ncbi:hypothetical protein FHX08_004193 [Rhizobium sp. BK529]|nr:hypothetical protein [Rhizobium sp. BK529]TCR95991.1 hypothetical protein EV281_11240 [Rhizobium sp. BK418]
MRTESRWNRHIDVLEYIGCVDSAGSDSRAALELCLLQTRPIFMPDSTADERSPRRHWRINGDAGGHR